MIGEKEERKWKHNIITLGLSLPFLKGPGPSWNVCFHPPGLLFFFLYPLQLSLFSFLLLSFSSASCTLAPPSLPEVLFLLPVVSSLFLDVLVIQSLSYHFLPVLFELKWHGTGKIEHCWSSSLLQGFLHFHSIKVYEKKILCNCYFCLIL